MGQTLQIAGPMGEGLAQFDAQLLQSTRYKLGTGAVGRERRKQESNDRGGLAIRTGQRLGRASRSRGRRLGPSTFDRLAPRARDSVDGSGKDPAERAALFRNAAREHARDHVLLR